METFNFYIDEKKTIWYRGHFSIEAKTVEEATEKAKMYIEEDTDGDDWDWEQLTDTAETLSLIDNDGWPTRELYDEDGEVIIDNLNK
jgi:hypothetical protein